MSHRVQGKTALVTGAASGIGLACATRLACEGATVIATDIQLRAALEAAAPPAHALEYLQLDVTREDEWAAVIAAIDARHGRLDVLVNNAGIALRVPTPDMNLADFRRQMAVNVEGVFLGCKHAIPLMRRNGGGSIINLSSTAGLRGSPNMAGYSASKGAVRLFTKALAVECAQARDGIRVNSVHPGLIDTPLWPSMDISGKVSKLDLDDLSARLVPLGVKGEPLDIANGVLWLASDESRYVTGAQLVIDGGMSGH
jgi:NAD(P)-dependent dehydrogenase (short-subunit alcohol dehydrogenase family)